MHAALITVAVLMSGAAPDPPASRQREAIEIPPDWSTLSVDELIDRLPVFETAADQMNFLPTEADVKRPAADELRERIKSGLVLSDAQWRRALLETHAVQYRSEWPVDHAFVIAIHQPHWLPAVIVRLDPRPVGLSSVRGGTIPSCLGVGRQDDYQDVGFLTGGSTELCFDVRVEDLHDRSNGEPKLYWMGELTIPVVVHSSLEEVLAPVADRRVDAALRNALRTICLGHQEDSAGHMSVLAVDPLPEDRDLFHGLALSMRLEVLNGSEVVATYPLSPECPRAGRDDPWLDLGLGGELVPELDRFLHRRQGEAAAWSLRLVGNTDNVLRHWNADRYWTGSITVPLLEPRRRELDREEADRWNGWWIHWFTQGNHPYGRTRD